MDLHDEIVKLRPHWYSPNDDKGIIKVVMTGNASEGPRVAEHARNKLRREDHLLPSFGSCSVGWFMPPSSYGVFRRR
jgi:hypothetical protein